MDLKVRSRLVLYISPIRTTLKAALDGDYICRSWLFSRKNTDTARKTVMMRINEIESNQKSTAFVAKLQAMSI